MLHTPPSLYPLADILIYSTLLSSWLLLAVVGLLLVSLCLLSSAPLRHILSLLKTYIYIYHPSTLLPLRDPRYSLSFHYSHLLIFSSFPLSTAPGLFGFSRFIVSSKFHLLFSVLSCTTACPSSCPLISYLLYPPPRTVVCFSTYLIVKHGSRKWEREKKKRNKTERQKAEREEERRVFRTAKMGSFHFSFQAHKKSKSKRSKNTKHKKNKNRKITVSHLKNLCVAQIIKHKTILN